MSNTQIRAGIGARRTGTLARIAAIAPAAMSSVAGARPVTLGNAALPPPAPPGGVGASGYYGPPGGGWGNEAAANQQGFWGRADA